MSLTLKKTNKEVNTLYFTENILFTIILYKLQLCITKFHLYCTFQIKCNIKQNISILKCLLFCLRYFIFVNNWNWKYFTNVCSANSNTSFYLMQFVFKDFQRTTKSNSPKKFDQKNPKHCIPYEFLQLRI